MKSQTNILSTYDVAHFGWIIKHKTRKSPRPLNRKGKQQVENKEGQLIN